MPINKVDRNKVGACGTCGKMVAVIRPDGQDITVPVRYIGGNFCYTVYSSVDGITIPQHKYCIPPITAPRIALILESENREKRSLVVDIDTLLLLKCPEGIVERQARLIDQGDTLYESTATQRSWKVLGLIPAERRDWPEDFADENGYYYCTCAACDKTFMGYKRRVICKLCNS